MTNEYTLNCNDPICTANQFWKATKAKITLYTFQFVTHTSIGSIRREQQNYIGCFASDESKPFYSRYEIEFTSVTYAMAINSNCVNDILTKVGPNYVSTSITRADVEVTYLDGTTQAFQFSSLTLDGTVAVSPNADGQWVKFTFPQAGVENTIAERGFHHATIAMTFLQNTLQTVFDETIMQYTHVFEQAYDPLELQYFQTNFIAFGPLIQSAPFNTYATKLANDGITKTKTELFIIFTNGTVADFDSEEHFLFG